MNYDLILYHSPSGSPDLQEAEELEAQAVNDVDTDLLSMEEGAQKEIAASDLLRKMTRSLGAEDAEVSSEDRVVIHLPYDKQDEEIEFLFSDTQSYLEQLSDQGAYFVYDPQAGKAFDPKETRFDWTEVYKAGAEMIAEISSEDFDL